MSSQWKSNKFVLSFPSSSNVVEIIERIYQSVCFVAYRERSSNRRNGGYVLEREGKKTVCLCHVWRQCSN